MIVRCRGCGTKLLALRKGELTLKSAMVKFDESGQAHARCYASGCNVDTPIVGLSIAAPEAAPRRVRVRRRVDSAPET